MLKGMGGLQCVLSWGGIVLVSSDKYRRRIPGFSSLVSIDLLCLDNKELGGRANCGLIPAFLSEVVANRFEFVPVNFILQTS